MTDIRCLASVQSPLQIIENRNRLSAIKIILETSLSDWTCWYKIVLFKTPLNNSKNQVLISSNANTVAGVNIEFIKHLKRECLCYALKQLIYHLRQASRRLFPLWESDSTWQKPIPHLSQKELWAAAIWLDCSQLSFFFVFFLER